MRRTEAHVLTALEVGALSQALQDPSVVSGLSVIFEFEKQLADEYARNEALGDARPAQTAQWAARAKVFNELLGLISRRVGDLSTKQR
jgi:hypothetical protein